MSEQMKPKANWDYTNGPVSVSEKGFMKITDPVTGHTGMFSVAIAKLIVNSSEELLAAIAVASERQEGRSKAKDLEKAQRQAAKLLEKERQKATAALEALQRAGITGEQIAEFLNRKVG